MNQNEYQEIMIPTGTTLKRVEIICNYAKENNITAVCVTPYYVNLVSELLEGKSIDIATIIGSMEETTEVKSYAAIDAIQHGATEINLILNISMVKNELYDDLKEELEEIRDCIDGKILKLVIDGTTVTEEELIKVVTLCNETFIHYVELSNVTEAQIYSVLTHKGEVLEVKLNDIKEEQIKWLEQGITRFGIKGEYL